MEDASSSDTVVVRAPIQLNIGVVLRTGRARKRALCSSKADTTRTRRGLISFPDT